MIHARCHKYDTFYHTHFTTAHASPLSPQAKSCGVLCTIIIWSNATNNMYMKLSLERGQAQDCNLYLQFAFVIICTHNWVAVLCLQQNLSHVVDSWHAPLQCTAPPQRLHQYRSVVQRGGVPNTDIVFWHYLCVGGLLGPGTDTVHCPRLPVHCRRGVPCFQCIVGGVSQAPREEVFPDTVSGWKDTKARGKVELIHQQLTGPY